MATREELQTQKRDIILTTARALISESSQAGFSMRTLAERAQVSIATPYNLFGSKQSILVALLNEHLESYQEALTTLHADSIEVLFEAIHLMMSMLRAESEFYRNALAEVIRDGGQETRQTLGGPRFMLWRRLVGEATHAGMLTDTLDPDPFTLALQQLMFAPVQDWAMGFINSDQLDARMRYGLALSLLAIATNKSRGTINQHLHKAEADLKTIWQADLIEHLREGTLDETSREILADQIAELEPTTTLQEKFA